MTRAFKRNSCTLQPQKEIVRLPQFRRQTRKVCHKLAKTKSQKKEKLQKFALLKLFQIIPKLERSR